MKNYRAQGDPPFPHMDREAIQSFSLSSTDSDQTSLQRCLREHMEVLSGRYRSFTTEEALEEAIRITTPTKRRVQTSSDEDKDEKKKD